MIDRQEYNKLNEVAEVVRKEPEHISDSVWYFMTRCAWLLEGSNKKRVYLQVIEHLAKEIGLNVNFTISRECLRLGCIESFEVNLIGRPRKYCSNKCKTAHNRDNERSLASESETGLRDYW